MAGWMYVLRVERRMYMSLYYELNINTIAQTWESTSSSIGGNKL